MMVPVTQPAEVFTSASSVQATGDVSAIQPGKAPGTREKSAATMTATWPVEAVPVHLSPASALSLAYRLHYLQSASATSFTIYD